MANNLYWVFTRYGRNRLINFIETDYLYLYKIRIGSYDWYEDKDKILGAGGYSEQAFRTYFESKDETALGEEINNGIFSISGKDIVEDANGRKTVVLSSVIPEDFPECTIGEIGLYETVDGVDHLFAICTLQSYHRADSTTNHYISSKLNIRLTSSALASSYDRIVINPDTDFATANDLISIEENVLFIESNLADQISSNAQLIGLNRAQQLYDKILDDKKKFASFAATTAYSNFLNITDLAKVPAFWVFQPNTIFSKSIAISDLSNNGINLSADMLSKQYDNGYEGLCSWLNFKTGHEYSLGSDVKFSLITDDRIATKDLPEEGTAEVVDYKSEPFSFFWVGSHNRDTEGDYTLLAKDNEDTIEENPPEFLFQVTKDRKIKVRLYTNRANYLEVTTPENSVPVEEMYVLSITYNGDFSKQNPFTIQVNGKKVYTTVEFSKGITKFKGLPVKEYKRYQIPLTSYIPTPNGNKNYVNSKVAMMTLIKDDLSANFLRAVIFNFMALIGKNPCLM